MSAGVVAVTGCNLGLLLTVIQACLLLQVTLITWALSDKSTQMVWGQKVWLAQIVAQRFLQAI